MHETNLYTKQNSPVMLHGKIVGCNILRSFDLHFQFCLDLVITTDLIL